MNQYHIYEAIGHGKYSTVYKARKKKLIEYFAVKSVDKCHKSKVLQEVKILHALDHPNVLKFYAWYETSAHFWLVLEYCVGGDFLKLLQQDTQLPEDSIHDLALDIVAALQFLHSNGIIYCDLKPSNILLDENGHIKLCDFGLARKVSDISEATSCSLPQAKRGTPSYMAPELFQDGGVHSYASDLWALGCVLYECYTGRPPFLGKEFTQLAKSIISDPVPPLPGNPSHSLVNLINSLLVKNPAERIQWPELCAHAFWKTKFHLLPLPSQPAFTSMVELSSKPHLSEQNANRQPNDRTPVKHREKEKGNLKQDENLIPGSRCLETPVKSVNSRCKTLPKVSTRPIENKQRDPSSATKGGNLLRLSRIAKSNLQRENDKENYRRPLPNARDNEDELRIENNDMELDFNDNVEDEPNDECDGSSEHSASDPDKNVNVDQNQGNVGVLTDNHAESAVAVNDSEILDQESMSQFTAVAATVPPASPQSRTQKAKVVSDHGIESDSCKPTSNLADVLWHPSDLSVRPVMPSRKADKISDAITSLPFDALLASEFVKKSKEQLDAFLNKIVVILNGNHNVVEKQNVIRYLETLSNNVDAANILTNGSVMLVLVKMLRQSKASTLRVQLASVIGLLIRYSTFIEDNLENSGILGSLSDGLRDKQEKVRRFSMAALGELLFYISTRNQQTRDDNAPGSQSKDQRSTSGWQVPGTLISLVSSMLRKGEDDIIQLYALRTIENIFSQGGQWVVRFTCPELINNLCCIFRAAGKQESIRLTAGSCLVRLVRFNSPCIPSAVEKLSIKDMASALVKGSPREQQINLNLLNMVMLGSHMFNNIGRHILLLVEDKTLVPNLISLIDQGSEVLRGKTLILVALLCKHGRRWLPHFFCNGRLLSIVDRLAREKDIYLQRCLDAFMHAVSTALPGLLDIISADIQLAAGGRRHGHVASLTSRATLKNNTHLFPVILHLLGSSSFKSRVVSYQVLRHLANLIKLVESPFQGRDDFQITLLRILESVIEEQSAVLESANIFVYEILPSLSVLYKGNKDGDARFLCLKILFDVMIIFLNEPSEDTKKAEELRSISNKLFLPLYPMFIEDEDPSPMFAQKLLVMLIEFDYIQILDILHVKTVQQCFEFLLGDPSNANVNNVRLCLALASAPELETKILSQLKVVRRIGNLLEFVKAKDMEDFMEPTLSLCRAFLLRSTFSRKCFNYSKEPTLLSDGTTPEPSTVVDQQQCIRDITDFGCHVGLFLELCRFVEPSITDIASECMVLLLKVAPREATTGLLTNLSKVGSILESAMQCVSQLLTQRMLHALGYACKQYVSHAMILAITVPEISKVKALVSEFKKSSIPAVATAASLAALELDRLPRCI
ncbi:hypothetical protein Dimus_001262 [Dionaea muscipula]